MSGYGTRKKGLSQAERDELAKLAALPEEGIDTADIPEAPAESWAQAVRPDFYRPLKQPVTIRLDRDVVAWFKARGARYQTEVNRVLRQYMEDHLRSR